MSSAFHGALLSKASRFHFHRVSSLSSSKILTRAYSSTTPSLNSPNPNQSAVKITPRSENFSTWYNDILSAADMVDSSPVRGFMIIKPWGMAIWDEIRSELDRRIKKTGTSNAYFPLLIPRSYLAKESEHVAGFAKECAVVTHHRLKATDDGKNLIPDPEAQLNEPLIVRPTSEAIIWPTYSRWIHSYRDLPLKLNQWANVVRWEMRTRPFLRTSEFLWQEGHTAHATQEEARGFTIEILNMYRDFCEKYLAIPVIPGVKSDRERFAGATDTYTIESMMMNGWALQTATSHFLGQGFGQAFDVGFLNQNNERETVWATSWGISTRLIGALLLSHGDDTGIILPPKIAPQQVVIVPVFSFKKDGSETKDNKDDEILKLSKSLVELLNDNNIRATLDDRKDIRVGNKRYEWERKGVPLRLEIGTKELESQSALLSRRLALSEHTIYKDEAEKAEYVKLLNDTSSKKKFTPTLKRNLSLTDKTAFLTNINSMLADIQTEMFNVAKHRLETNTHPISTYDELKKKLQPLSGNKPLPVEQNGDVNSEEQEFDNALVSNGMNNPGFYLVPWHADDEAEEAIKNELKLTIRCYPFDHNKQPPAAGTPCFYSGKQATHMAIFARNF